MTNFVYHDAKERRDDRVNQEWNWNIRTSGLRLELVVSYKNLLSELDVAIYHDHL
jgi:hypothetical protein